MNLKFIWDVVSQIKIGKAGHAYVVDSHGHLIAHPDISLVLKKTDLSALDQVKAALGVAAQGAGMPSIARDLDGRQVLSASARISPLGWAVLIEQPLLEAFEPIRWSIIRTIGLALFGVLLSVLASLLLARRMVPPHPRPHGRRGRDRGGRSRPPPRGAARATRSRRWPSSSTG